jgi:oligopeptide/dipeptide ABC transporter ATP-binding protein
VSPPLVELQDLVTEFGGRRRFLAPPPPVVRAVDRVSLTVEDGEILGLVGESGCGKSTLAKTVLGVQRETSGVIRIDGRVVSGVDLRTARHLRRDIQYVHQDPGAALDPWWRIGRTLDEALWINGVTDQAERLARVDAMLDAVGLDTSFRSRYPHELSGGQQRRIGLARVLTLKPRVVILDEPTSGLDLSVQATVLRLIRDLRGEFGLTYVLISHDLSVVERMCDRVAIMYLGRIVEIGPATTVFARPRHPYTRALLDAAPRLATGQIEAMQVLPGEVPSPSARPSGCGFRTRCAHARAECAASEPTLLAIGSDAHCAACLRLADIHDDLHAATASGRRPAADAAGEPAVTELEVRETR